MHGSELEFVVTRTVNAPRERVWQAWSQADQLAQWWGPKGCTLQVLKLDFRPGGLFHYAMEFQPGKPMYGRFIYQEMQAPERLVYVSSFADADGNITRAPFPTIGDTWPLEVHNILTLAEADGRTVLTLRGAPLRASEAEHKTFAGMFDSMRQGFAGTFDQLESYLAKP